MLPNRAHEVKVRANFDGEVEVLVRAEQRVYATQRLVVVEGDHEIETLSSRNAGRVVSVHARTGETVAKGALLLTLVEDPPAS